eukprot:4351271-Amphidinium_carterae.1
MEQATNCTICQKKQPFPQTIRVQAHVQAKNFITHDIRIVWMRWTALRTCAIDWQAVGTSIQKRHHRSRFICQPKGVNFGG